MEVQRHTQISTPFFACVFQFHKGIPTVLQGASASLILEKQFLLLALRSPLAPLKLHQKFPAVGHDGGFASFVLLTRKERGINDLLDGPEAAGEKKGNYTYQRAEVYKRSRLHVFRNFGAHAAHTVEYSCFNLRG
jgi:hypothetical protein